MTDASIRSTSSTRRGTRATGIRTTCGRGCGPRRRSRTSSRRGTSRSGRSRSTPTSWRSRSSRCGSRARRGSRSRRAGAGGAPSEMVVMLDPPRHGPMRRVASGRFTPTRGARPAGRHRSHRGRDPRRRDAGERRRRARLRRAHRGAVPARGDRLDPRRAARRLGAAVPVDQRGHRQGRSRVPPTRREPGPDDQARARGELHAYFHAADRRAPRATRGRPGQRADPRPRSTARRSPRSSSSRTASSSSRPATRRRATRSAAGCSRSPSTATSGRSCAPDPSCCPTRSRRSCAGSARSATSPAPRPRTARSAASTIGAGEQVALYFASANRDEEVFDDPFAFPRRSPPEPAPRVRLR